MTFDHEGREVSDFAFGPCAVCGADTKGSTYWAGIGPSPTLFAPGANKPFCSAACSEKYARAPGVETGGSSEGGPSV
ncbi:hypothetical protein [Denitrobaculum tricleocarpae]|uniref:Uncharacterized protein n=1 Tax=Denitrobaculum tricleocarpae TaxID=2591009 RepID=A0A545TKP3_9PROT|nr:hypothetical protein [Denitrobaculum tricleocarpae]TQV77800.1 hypothetical protein FKG95_19780 [Denitrobaculum tricleocarpae]